MEQCAFGNSRMLSILKQVRNQLMTRLVSREEQAKKRQVEKKTSRRMDEDECGWSY